MAAATVSAEAEATVFIEHLFSTVRELEGQMPDLLAFARGVGYANFIQMIIGGAGISGRRLESAASLLGKRAAYDADYSLERGSTLFDVLADCTNRYLTTLPVVFPRTAPALPRHSSYPQYRSHVPLAHKFVDTFGRGIR